MSDKNHFEVFIEQASCGMFRCTLGKTPQFIFMNEFLRQTLGFNQKDIQSIAVEDIFLEKNRFNLFSKMVQLQDGHLENFETKISGKDQKNLWCSFSAHITKDADGKSKWLDVIVLDISQRKAVEKDLIESKELFQTVFNNTAAMITVTDKNERIVAWNPFAEKLLGMDNMDLFNKPVSELYPAAEWKLLRSLRIRQKGILDDIETQIIRKDGTLLDVHLSVSILKDLEGNISGSIGIIRDITSQKAAEKLLTESENKVRIILNNSPAAITMTDADEKIISWNKYAEHLLAMNDKELYMLHVSQLYPPEEWQKIRDQKIRKIGSKHHLETKIVTKQGKMIPVDLSINIIRDTNGEITGSVGIMQDITQQKEVQEMLIQAKLAAELANKTKSMFLANMSHEVRTPMNAIMGMLDLTLDTPLNDEQKDNLSVAKDAADNLLGLLNDILDLSRVESGKITLEQIEFHLPNVVKSVTKGLAVIALKKNLKLEAVIDKDVPELIKGDPVRLRQILINLINNAIKFTHKGTIYAKVKVSQIKDNQAVLQFSVVDQGIGIPPDKHEKVFEVFTQADDSTNRRFGGTGLGLAICKRLTEMMGGSIWVESEEGKGSTFHFTGLFDVIALKSTVKDDHPVVSSGPLTSMNHIKILLAEDNMVNQKIAIRMLEKQGWNVTAVENGQEVINRLDNEKFDVVLMDAQMPILDGLEATRLIRQNEKTTGKHIPIIALTARAMTEDREELVKAGMDGYVAKPIDRQKLFEEIEKILTKGINNE